MLPKVTVKVKDKEENVTMKHNTPFTAKEKERALNLLKQTNNDLIFVAHRYHCTVRTLYRWKRRFDGSLSSLENHSSRPHTMHPTAHTEEELNQIRHLIRRNPNAGLNELYGKLRQRFGYRRNPVSLYRVLKRMGFYANKKVRQPYKPKPYDTPARIGVKWQLDVKYVPTECNNSRDPVIRRYFQYTVIDEATRQRFLYAYEEQTAYSTVDFVIRAIRFFGYRPRIIQTDNGQEFTHLSKTERVHPFDRFCEKVGILHQLIKPRTPRHNGKVERSHRNDNERFYRFLRFYSFQDLQVQMAAYLKRSNQIPISTLKSADGKTGWMTPMQKREELMKAEGWI